MSLVLTGAEDPQLLCGGDDVEVSGEEVDEGARINHKNKHPKSVHSHLLPETRENKGSLIS